MLETEARTTSKRRSAASAPGCFSKSLLSSWPSGRWLDRALRAECRLDARRAVLTQRPAAWLRRAVARRLLRP